MRFFTSVRRSSASLPRRSSRRGETAIIILHLGAEKDIPDLSRYYPHPKLLPPRLQ